jgi:tetratricopeptide (TPR) repeat protein
MYRRVLVVDPCHAPTLSSLGRVLEELHHDIDGAEDLYKRALAVDPHSRHALLHYGKLLQFARRDMSGAEGLYRRLLGINSQKVNVLVHICAAKSRYTDFSILPRPGTPGSRHAALVRKLALQERGGGRRS